jgi:hypothetical protein
MKSMVERVARAICALEYQDPGELTNAIPDGPLYPVWKDFEKFAKAAIEAMRNPPHDVLLALSEAMSDDRFDAGMMEFGWDAAIDAALKEHEEGK